ncbi:uncharacterized protein [Miscanthus floridulus]|uniref:uncharacterized protein n=1 Tax=Miscanthus floridulus TaxID=154761 RepID=UPI003457DA16
MPYHNLRPDPVLRTLLLSIPQRKIVFTNSDKAHVEEALHRLGLYGLLCSQITRTWQFGVQSLSFGNRMDCISKIKTLGLFLSRNTSKLISTGKKLKIASAMTSIQFKVSGAVMTRKLII